MAKKTNDKMVKEGGDGLTKDERRNRNLKLKADAKKRAFDEKLNWFDDIPAAQFHQNFDEAFKIATTHAKAIELLVDPNASVAATETSASMTTANAEAAAMPKTIADKAAEAVERFEERNKTPAQLTVEAAKAALTGNVANDNTETKADEVQPEPVAEVVDTTTTENAAEVAVEETQTETVSEEPTASENTSDAVADTTTETLTNEFDENGKLIRWPGESSNKYGRRAHKAKLAKAWTKPTEQETRNGEPPVTDTVLPGLPQGKTPSEINKELPVDAPVVIPEAVADPMLKRPDETKAAWKARKKLLLEAAKPDAVQETAEPTKSALESANVFEAAEMGEETKVSPTEVALKNFAGEIKQIAENYTAAEVPDATETGTEEATTTENPADDTPVEEAPNNQPAEVQEPVQTEPVSTPTEPGPVEAKTTKKPTLTLVAKDNLTPEETAAAKKFYGTGWKDESAALLCKALFWLNKAVEYDSNIRSGKAPANPKINPRVSYRLAMNAALKHEAEAFGNKPVELSLTEVVKMFADFPDNHQKAA